MTMYDLLNDFLDDEEILLSNLKDQMIDEVHTSVSSQEYAKAASVSDAIRNIEHSLGV
jgi:protein-arginine kinase activator protein McsA